MSYLLLIVAVVGSGVVGSHFFPTEEMLQDRFALGQRYYAANDHDNSVQIFNEIEKTPNYALLDVDRIEVTIGDLVLPIRVAATYQLGNSNRNVGRTLLERSRNAAAEGDSLVASRRWDEAQTSFNASKSFYRQLVDRQEGVPEHLQVMASYQIVRASYQMEDYPAVVRDAEEILRRFPGSEYHEAALYDAGWAQYHMGQYQEAIEAYQQLLASAADVLKFDRALFQIGESYFALSDYEEARTWYRKLVDKYDFSTLSEKELQEMKTQRLRGLVEETTRELVAKAQIRIADSHALQKDIPAAIHAYSQVPERYPQEDLLVQKSYDNMATMVLQERGTRAGIEVLRQAIERVADAEFRGRVQLKIAKAFYGAGDFAQAISEYEVYKKAYGDRALAIGVPLDQVDFLVAEAYRDLARIEDREENLQRARDRYRYLLEQYPKSTRRPEAQYGLGHAEYGLGNYPQAAASFAAAAAAPRAPVVPHALNWQARLAFAAGEYEEALHWYQEVLDQYPGSVLEGQIWKDKALVYKKLGRVDEAIAAFAQVERESAVWTKVQAEAGEMLLAAGRLDEFETQFDIKGAIESSADDGETRAELHYIQARIARELGDPQAEIEHMSEALAHGENEQLRAYAFFFRGLAYYRQGGAADAQGDSLAGRRFFESALEDLDQLLASSPAAQVRGVAYRTRGVALTRLDRSAEAVKTYEILIDSAPNPVERAEFKLMLMELYYDQDQLDETETVARAIIEEEGVGRKIVERAYFVLVSLLLEEERYAESLNTAQRALARFPDSEHHPTLILVEARSLFFLERYEKAATVFARFITAYPDHNDRSSALYQKGYCHEFLGHFEEAAAAFGALVDGDPSNALAADALYRKGENLYNASQFKPALTAYLRVGSDYGRTSFAAKALYSASWTYMDLGREEESLATMERLVGAYPQSDYARFAQFSIGDYYYSKKELERAQEAYRLVADRYSESPEAVKAAALIADLDEDMASRAYDEVFALFDRGNYAEAVRGFERIYQHFPGSYSALAALANKGVALEHLGNSEDARGTYEQVLQVAAGNPELATIAEFVVLRLDNL